MRNFKDRCKRYRLENQDPNQRDMNKIMTQYYENIEDIIDSMDAWICVINKNTYDLVFMNKKIKEMFFNVSHRRKCYKLFGGEEIEKPCDFCPIKELHKADGKESLKFYNPYFKVWVETTVASFIDLDGSDNYLITSIDITKQREYEEKLKKVAYLDGLLEIPNRKCFIKDMESCTGKMADRGVLLTLDLCNFRGFNDVFTHKYGDVLLKKVTEYLKSIAKEGKLYRYAGDRFVILFRGYNKEQAKVVASEIFYRFSSGWDIKNVKYNMDINMGMILYNEGYTIDSFISSIDHIIEESKSIEKSGLVIYDEILGDKIARKNRILEAMIYSMRQGDGFQVYYQPIYNLDKKRFIKAEALLRFYNKDLGAVSPEEFIPVAEESGIINDLGILVIKKVCEKIKDMNSKNLKFNAIAVNISSVQFLQENFVSKVKDVINFYDIKGENLEFEITESILIHSFDKVKEVMRELREIGIRFSLDDFGTGYSALSYLLNLPINCLKIDKSFIDQVEENEKSKAMLKNIINLGHDLDMQIIAEGVETQNQFNILSALSCHNIQGYYLSKPLPEDEFSKVFVKR